jgi:hypothetical protein
LQLVGTASTVPPSRVKDAGNGYLTSSRTVSVSVCVHAQAMAGDKVAESRTAQAARLEVEGPAGARDNKSTAEVDKRHLFQGNW